MTLSLPGTGLGSLCAPSDAHEIHVVSEVSVSCPGPSPNMLRASCRHIDPIPAPHWAEKAGRLTERTVAGQEPANPAERHTGQLWFGEVPGTCKDFIPLPQNPRADKRRESYFYLQHQQSLVPATVAEVSSSQALGGTYQDGCFLT